MDDTANSSIGLAVDEQTSKPVRRPRPLRYSIYLLIGLSLVWLPTAFYLKTAKDMYRSHWSLIIPGSGVGSSLNIDEIGQATTSVASPFTSSSVDPKVNYKAVVLTSTVLKTAAKGAGLSLSEFGKPLVKLVDQTSIMKMTMEAETAELAFLKSRKLYEALEWKLDLLRADERAKIVENNVTQLDNYRTNVATAKAELFEFQSTAQIITVGQLDRSLEQIGELRNRRSETLLKIASNSGRVDALLGASGLTPSRSNDVIKLQQDSTLSELQLAYNAQFKEYLETSATLGNRNQKVLSLKSKLDSLTEAISDRSRLLLGYEDESFVDRYLPMSGDDASVLYREHRSASLELEVDYRELQELDSMIEALESGLSQSSQAVAKLEELKRAYQVAETIYLSALAKQDLGRSDIFASYPMTQMLVEPSLPEKPERLHRVFAILGSIVGSFFVVLALIISWKRAALLLKLSRKK